MVNVGDQVDIENTIHGQTGIGRLSGRVASVKGDKIEVEFPDAAGQTGKLSVTKDQLRPGGKAGQWSLTTQIKLSSA